MSNVVVATTMWGEVKQENGNRRETELKASFWKGPLKDGCQVKRFNDTYESAWDVVGCQPVDQASAPHETAEHDPKQTEAGITLYDKLKTLLQHLKIAARKRVQTKTHFPIKQPAAPTTNYLQHITKDDKIVM